MLVFQNISENFLGSLHYLIILHWGFMYNSWNSSLWILKSKIKKDTSKFMRTSPYKDSLQNKHLRDEKIRLYYIKHLKFNICSNLIPSHFFFNYLHLIVICYNKVMICYRIISRVKYADCLEHIYFYSNPIRKIFYFFTFVRKIWKSLS